MTQLVDRDILGEIASMVAEALQIDRTDLTPESRLILDLGAESIDFIDVQFRLEQKYDLVIEEGDIIAHIGAELTADDIAEQFTIQSIVDFIQFRLHAR